MQLLNKQFEVMLQRGSESKVTLKPRNVVLLSGVQRFPDEHKVRENSTALGYRVLVLVPTALRTKKQLAP